MLCAGSGQLPIPARRAFFMVKEVTHKLLPRQRLEEVTMFHASRKLCTPSAARHAYRAMHSVEKIPVSCMIQHRSFERKCIAWLQCKVY